MKKYLKFQYFLAEPVKALFAKNSMIGIGVTPEGIETNYVLYDLMLEMGWRNKTVETQRWLQEYATRRYGVKNDAVNTAWEVCLLEV